MYPTTIGEVQSLEDRRTQVRATLINLEENRDKLLDRLSGFEPESELYQELTRLDSLFEQCEIFDDCSNLSEADLTELEKQCMTTQQALNELLKSFRGFLDKSRAAKLLTNARRRLAAGRSYIRDEELAMDTEEQWILTNEFDCKMMQFERKLAEDLPVLESVFAVAPEWIDRLKEMVGDLHELQKAFEVEITGFCEILAQCEGLLPVNS